AGGFATIASVGTNAASLRSWPSFADVQNPAAEFLAVQTLDSPVRLVFIRHVDKRESARAAGVPIGHQTDANHLAVRLERRAQLGLGRLKTDISHEQILHYPLLRSFAARLATK